MAQPLQTATLSEAGDHLSTLSPSTPPEPMPASSVAPILDQERLWVQVDYDRELLQELVQLFLEDMPQSLEELRTAVEHNQAAALAEAAHRLKGSLGSMSAPQAFDIAAQLEMIGRRGELHHAAAAYHALETALATLTPVLTALAASDTPVLP